MRFCKTDSETLTCTSQEPVNFEFPFKSIRGPAEMEDLEGPVCRQGQMFYLDFEMFQQTFSGYIILFIYYL